MFKPGDKIVEKIDHIGEYGNFYNPTYIPGSSVITILSIEKEKTYIRSKKIFRRDFHVDVCRCDSCTNRCSGEKTHWLNIDKNFRRATKEEIKENEKLYRKALNKLMAFMLIDSRV